MPIPAPIDPQSPAHAAALSHMDALPPGTRLGEFELRALLGVGGFGMVYAAFDHSLQRPVAIKEYMPSGLAGRSAGTDLAMRSTGDDQTFQAGLTSFINEARLLAQFDHPSLVKVYRFWEANNTAYMAMPLYRGITLNEARRHMRTPPPEAWLRTVLASVLGALDVLHKANTTHRDVSPDNIFLQDVGPPVLLDLGAARRAISDRSHRHTAILKINYAPIEQYADARDMRQGPWTDLYSLAAVVHGCLCNEAPLPATFRVLRDRLQPLDSVVRTVAQVFGQTYSPAFVAAVSHGLGIRPEDRPQDVDEFAREMSLDRTQNLARFDWRAELGPVFSATPMVVDAPPSDGFSAERLTQPMTTVPQALLPPTAGGVAAAARTVQSPTQTTQGVPPPGSAPEFTTAESLVTGPAPLESGARSALVREGATSVDLELDTELASGPNPAPAPPVAGRPAATRPQPPMALPEGPITRGSAISPIWWGVGLVGFLVLAFSLVNLARAPQPSLQNPSSAASAPGGLANPREEIITETAAGNRTDRPVAAAAVPSGASGSAVAGATSGASGASGASGGGSGAARAGVADPGLAGAAASSATSARSPTTTLPAPAARASQPAGAADATNTAKPALPPTASAPAAPAAAARPAPAAASAPQGAAPSAVPSAAGATTNVATGGVLGQQATAKPGAPAEAATVAATPTAAVPPRASAAREPAPPPCGDASVFGRPMCLHRECQRAEHAAHRQCVEHRDLQERSKRLTGPNSP